MLALTSVLIPKAAFAATVSSSLDQESWMLPYWALDEVNPLLDDRFILKWLYDVSFKSFAISLAAYSMLI